MALEEYKKKRNFRRTPEPPARPGKAHRKPTFVIQEHHASHLHYDFRLEADGVLKSWAVPKQPSLDPAQKRLAVQVEDHPLAYGGFAGTIPEEGQYGAGTVHIWDHGTYDNLLEQKPVPQSVTEGIAAGRLEFALHGEKLHGRFALIRMKGRKSGGKDNWLLIKMKDPFARPAGTSRGREAAGGRKTAPSRSRLATRRRGSGKSAGGPDVQLTNADKVLFPDAGVTKGDVFDYYRRIAPRLLPYLCDRPITLERLPEGVGDGKPHFWQKHTPTYYPDWVPRVELPTEKGTSVEYTLVNDERTLLYLVNLGALTFHPWLARAGDLDRPDFVLFDLDPGRADFADVVEVARQLHRALDGEEKESFVKTSGKSGLHVLVPWDGGGFDEARAWARSVAEGVAGELPDRATLEISKAKRGRRVYIDVLQNARGKHVVPPYVLRPTVGATVSTPLDWREVKPGLDPAAFTLRTVFGRLARRKCDPWAALAARLGQPAGAK